MEQVILAIRAWVHLSSGDTLKIRSDGLLFCSAHFDYRLIKYCDVEDIKVVEYLGRNPDFPNAPESIHVTFRFSKVPDFTGHHKRDPKVEDEHYRSAVMMFDIWRREEVLQAITEIEKHRMTASRSLIAARFIAHDYDSQA